MKKYKNISIDSIEEDALTETEEQAQTSTEASITSVPESTPVTKRDVPKKRKKASIIASDIDEDISHEVPTTFSVGSLDVDVSQKYPITLEQARNRVLKAIKRSKKRNSMSIEDDNMSE